MSPSRPHDDGPQQSARPSPDRASQASSAPALAPGAPSARSPWKACGIVTLTTDFGTRDPYVGMMKGVLLAHARSATLVDVTHDVPPQDVRAAAWILKHSRRYFPHGTVHLAVVDPGVGSERRILVALEGDQAFVAPDNGLLAPLLSAQAEVFELDRERFARADSSRTFHGRDIMAPAAASLARGSAPAQCARAEVHDWVRLDLALPIRREAGAVTGEIVLADHFGNLISNLTLSDLESDPGADLGRWHLEAGARRIAIRSTYSEAGPGELLALVDSYGALEIAVRDGSAADVLQLGPGASITARRLA